MNMSGSSKKISYFLVFIVLFEGMIAKSAFFIGKDPTVLHYIASSLIFGVCILIVLVNNGFNLVRNFSLFFVFWALSWVGISTVFFGIQLELVALVTFALLLIGCYYAIPILSHQADIEFWRLLYLVLGLVSFFSALLYFVSPQLAYDPDSGRFSGSLISVAVACSVFSLFAVLAFYAHQVAQTSSARTWHASMVVLGLILLYLTKTRSSLIEAVFAIFLLWLGGRFAAKASQTALLRNVIMPVLVFFAGLAFIVAFAGGGIDRASQLDDFRLSDKSILDARGSNWDFGIERVLAAPVFGEGLLTKQTQGGVASVNLEEGKNYNPLYDPHNLILSLAVQGGIPFSLAIIILILSSFGYFLSAFGWREALRSPEFVICAVRTLIMVPAGGDLTSFGNSIDRIYWMLLGIVLIKAFVKKLSYGSHAKISISKKTHPRNLFA